MEMSIVLTKAPNLSEVAMAAAETESVVWGASEEGLKLPLMNFDIPEPNALYG